ncbi:MAG TPA: bifunctional pyr operon transcriptional regulator/uracil phosphoribosyltransferase PyrR [Candidatus Hydrogenedentes bacterium]|nr:bifunctional pyr operon transcriptional regulator/uracil phosphoribosyltransferase PyrR [Candidatus Hydrogenedentota bacterium]
MDRTGKVPFQTLVIMDADVMEQHIRRMAQEIIEDNPEVGSLVILGILRRGRPLGERLAQHIGQMMGVTPQVGSLATTLYRDDYRSGMGVPKPHGNTHFDFSLDGRTVLLVDDVLAAGRTIRAAMDEVMDYGRPKRIQLACLVDRGGRELPIQPEYFGWSIGTEPNEWVSVRLTELDGEDVVLLERYAAEEGA